MKLTEHCTASYSGQVNCVITAQDENGIILGYIEYSIFRDKPHIAYIKVEDQYRKRGIGKELIKELAKKYTYKNIDWGAMTEEGYKLKLELDSEFKI